MSTATAARPAIHSDLSLTRLAPIASRPRAAVRVGLEAPLAHAGCPLVILAVITWPYVWRNYVRATGDRWR
jgi:hypothetical protein